MPVDIKGTNYATVAERLSAAHGGPSGRPKGIQSIVTEFVPIGTAILCRATVTFADGRAFTGTSEVPIDSKQPAERDAPFECGETSAVGRSLANAGYPGSEKGLAGAEELLRPPRGRRALNAAELLADDPSDAAGQADEPRPGASANGHADPGSPGAPATTGQLRVLAPLLDFLGIERHTVIVDGLTAGQAADRITQYEQAKQAKQATLARQREAAR